MIRSLFVGAVLALAGVATASAADLVPAPVSPIAIETAEFATNYYIGGNVGIVPNGTNTTVYSVGVVAGVELTDNIAVEAAYDRSFVDLKSGSATTDLLTINAIASYDAGIVEPYVLAGLGYEWKNPGTDGFVYNLGAGARVAVTQDLDLDVRYRYVNSFDNQFDVGGEHRVTAGLLFKF